MKRDTEKMRIDPMVGESKDFSCERLRLLTAQGDGPGRKELIGVSKIGLMSCKNVSMNRKSDLGIIQRSGRKRERIAMIVAVA